MWIPATGKYSSATVLKHIVTSHIEVGELPSLPMGTVFVCMTFGVFPRAVVTILLTRISHFTNAQKSMNDVYIDPSRVSVAHGTCSLRDL